jgi:hypothetical protein
MCVRKAGGYVSIAFGVFMGLGVLSNAGGTHGVGALLFGFAVFCAVPIAFGWVLLRDGRARPRALDARRAWDSELMRLAARRHGSLTVAEVVTHADLDAPAAEEYLDDLCRRGLAEHRVTDDGHVVYRFNEAPSADAKRSAKDVLDD